MVSDEEKLSLNGIDCLIDLIEEITTALDQGEYALSIFLDLSKAFDAVIHFFFFDKTNLLWH